MHPTRSLAIMHLAVYDAVDAVDHRADPYVRGVRAPRDASAEAAADEAAQDSLVALDPGYAQHHQHRRGAGPGVGVRPGPLPKLGQLRGPAGATRWFPSFSAVAREAGLRRIYAGQHTRVDTPPGPHWAATSPATCSGTTCGCAERRVTAR